MQQSDIYQSKELSACRWHANGMTGSKTVLGDSALQQREAAKWQELQPYLVSSPKRGIIGNSKYAKRLRSQILAASKADAGCFPIPNHSVCRPCVQLILQSLVGVRACNGLQCCSCCNMH